MHLIRNSNSCHSVLTTTSQVISLLVVLSTFGSFFTKTVEATLTAVTFSNNYIVEGTPLSVICRIVGIFDFGSTIEQLIIVKYASQNIALHTGGKPLKEETTYSDIPYEITESTGWTLKLPWNSIPNRYAQSVTYNSTAVWFDILNSSVEDSGYYGCKFKDSYSSFVPLTVYEQNIRPQVSLLLGSKSSSVLLDPRPELLYDSNRLQSLNLAIRVNTSTAALVTEIKLENGEKLTTETLIKPVATAICRSDLTYGKAVLCRYQVEFMVSWVMNDTTKLHMTSIRLSSSSPAIRNVPSKVIWSVFLTLIDKQQSMKLIDAENMNCNPSQIEFKYDSKVIAGCTVPKLWLTVPGFRVRWSLVQSVQFYTRRGAIQCQYPDSACCSNQPIRMLDFPKINGSCHNYLGDSIGTTFWAKQSGTSKVFYYLEVANTYAVHASRKMVLEVSAEAKYTAKGAAKVTFQFIEPPEIPTLETAPNSQTSKSARRQSSQQLNVNLIWLLLHFTWLILRCY